MFTIHIISDLNLGFNEAALEEETIPDVDLVVISGNIGSLKRSALYIETLAKKYTDTQFFWGLGEKERFFLNVEKFDGELEENLKFRIKNTDFPKNIHWTFEDRVFIKLRNNQVVDLFYSYGFPYIISYEGNWEDTVWFRNYISHIEFDTEKLPYKPNETSNVKHGGCPIWATKEWINKNYDAMLDKIRVWENDKTGYKILVTHINQYNDSRITKQKISPYRIHLNNMAWVTSNAQVGNVNFMGAKLLTNPGRGTDCRSKIFIVDK